MPFDWGNYPNNTEDFFSFLFFISWRLITLQYCSGFCHTLTWISHGFTCVPHPDPPSHLPLHPIPLGLPSAPGLSACLMHSTEDFWESFGEQGDQTSQSWGKSTLNIHWRDWCWSCNTLATWYEELTHWKGPWCWERLETGGEGDDRGWDGWMAPPTQWTWVWANSRSCWRAGKPDMLQSMGSEKIRHDWATEQQCKGATVIEGFGRGKDVEHLRLNS